MTQGRCLAAFAIEDCQACQVSVANDLQYLFKVRTKMRRDWRPQAIWHLRQIAHEQHPENLILMLGDHCKYPSYDYAQLDKNNAWSSDPMFGVSTWKCARFYIRRHSPIHPKISRKSHIKKSAPLSVMPWTGWSDVDAYRSRIHPFILRF